MKKFTLIIGMFLIALWGYAEMSVDLQKKVLKVKTKTDRFLQQNNRFSEFSKSARFNSASYLKSAAVTQKLDSTVNRVFNEETQLWQFDYKDEYLFDSEMKNTAWVEKEWNLTSNSWEIISKTELGYDNNDRVNSMLMFDRDDLTQVLKKVSKILIFSNSEGMQDSMSMYSSEDDGVTWVLDIKQIFHYNEAKQLIKTDIWSIDDESGELMLSMNIVNTYTASGKIETSNMNASYEGEEIPWSLTKYEYDGSEKLTSIEFSTLNFMTFTMEKSSRITYQYNASGNLTVEINSSWMGASWVDNDKTGYEYNANGDVSVEIYSTWNGTAWIEEDKDEYTYGTTNFSEVAIPQIDFVLNIFSLFLNLMGMQESFNFSYVKVPAGINSFEMLNGSWKNTEKSAFYYSDGTSVNINDLNNHSISVYPNPATESIMLNWNNNHKYLNLQIFQITGTKVMDQNAFSGERVSVSHLVNGIYLVKLMKGSQLLFTGKLIKN